MAGKLIEAGVIKILIALRDPLILFNVVTAWMTFAVLNRPASTTTAEAETAKEGTEFVWTINLITSIFLTILAGLVIMKYVS